MSTESENELKKIYSELLDLNPDLKADSNLFLRRATPDGEITHIEYEDEDRMLLLYCATLTKGIVHCRMENNCYPGLIKRNPLKKN